MLISAMVFFCIEDSGSDGSVKAKPKIDSRTEVQKLFDRIKVSPRDFGGESPKAELKEKQSSISDEGGYNASDSFRQLVLSLIKDHDCANALLNFCLSIPALASVSGEKNAYLTVPETDLPTLVKR